MKITPETNPVMMMRRNQRLYPVPEKFKTSGQYYHRFLEGLTGAVRTTPLYWVGPIRKRESEFHSFLGNIRYAAACVIQKYYLRYKLKQKLRTNYFNTARHNDVNYYSVPATSRVDPVAMMRFNQRLYPVPEEFKTSGQYYVSRYDDLADEFDEACFESGRQAKKAEDRFRAFCHVSGNIRYAAACIIRKYYLCYKMKRKLRDMHRQRACVLIQRNFRRYSAQLRYEFWIWNEGLKEQQRNRTVAESIEYYWTGWKQREEAKERDERELMKAEEQEMEASNEYSVGGGCDCSLCCEQMDDDWIEMEAERDAQLEEDMERMREEYFY